MNLGEAKKRAIQLINEYSNNGSLIVDAKNADYTLRMNNLADYCQNEISDKVGIDATYTIDNSVTPDVTEDGYNKYNLPSDMKEHRDIRRNSEPFFEYKIENRQIWFNDGDNATFILRYYRYPTEIDGSTDDSHEFEVDAYTHTAIPYYLSGMVIADENASISDKLLNIYYERLGKMYKRSIEYPKRGRDKVRW